MIGREGFRGVNQNTECMHDSQCEGFILLSANQKGWDCPQRGRGQVLATFVYIILRLCQRFALQHTHPQPSHTLHVTHNAHSLVEADGSEPLIHGALVAVLLPVVGLMVVRW